MAKRESLVHRAMSAAKFTGALEALGLRHGGAAQLLNISPPAHIQMASTKQLKSVGCPTGEHDMRHALAALLFAAPICAFAAPALAQTAQGYDYGPAGPVGAVVTAPFYVLFAVFSGPFDWNAFPTVTANTGAPAYSGTTVASNTGARPIATAPHRLRLLRSGIARSSRGNASASRRRNS